MSEETSAKEISSQRGLIASLILLAVAVIIAFIVFDFVFHFGSVIMVFVIAFLVVLGWLLFASRTSWPRETA